jgi:hypothetical protein
MAAVAVIEEVNPAVIKNSLEDRASKSLGPDGKTNLKIGGRRVNLYLEPKVRDYCPACEMIIYKERLHIKTQKHIENAKIYLAKHE